MASMFNIQKLDDTNYDSWSLQVKSVLIHQDLWSVVSGSLAKPESNATNAAQVAEWIAKDEKATATIILCSTPIQIAHIKNCQTSSDTWKALKEVHRPKGPVRKVTLFKQLLQMHMSEDECAQQYICNFGSIVDKLAETGVTLQEELYVIMLLASLPKSYENLVVALEARDELPKLSTLKVKLVEEGERRKVNNNNNETASADNSMQVFMARENKEKKSNERNSYNRNKNNNGNNSSRKKSNFKCFNCGRNGHYAAQCREKGSKGEQKNDQTHRAFSITNERILQQNIWCVDSGASAHLCSNRNMFVKFEEHKEEIILAGSNRIQTEGKGEVFIKEFNLTLKDVLYVSCLQCNFISVGKAVSNGCTVVFNDKEAVIRKGGKVWLTAKRVGDLFLYGLNNNECFFSCESTEESLKWHKRFGHLNFSSLRQLINKEMVFGVNVKIPENISCNICMKCKCSVRPFQHSENRANDLLEIIHSDVCGPMNITSSGGARYMLTFIDDKSR